VLILLEVNIKDAAIKKPPSNYDEGF